VREQALTVGGHGNGDIPNAARSSGGSVTGMDERRTREQGGGSRRIQSGRKDAEENVMGRAPMAF
jgi:hypothetical protein